MDYFRQFGAISKVPIDQIEKKNCKSIELLSFKFGEDWLQEFKGPFIFLSYHLFHLIYHLLHLT